MIFWMQQLRYNHWKKTRTSAFAINPDKTPLYRRFNNANLGEADGRDTLRFYENVRHEYLMDENNKYKSLSIVLEGMEAVLKDGNILNLDDFGSFSLNGNFCEDKEPDENHRAESIQVKNVVLKRTRI